MPDETEDQILENALAPKKASGDSGSVEMHPIADQIAADRYKRSKDAASTPGGGIRRAKMIPGDSD